MPNLAIVNSSRGGMLVHRAGCRDLLRLNPVFETVWTEEHDSVQSVVESVYGDMMPEDGQPWTYYEPEFRFFPCCPALPRESVQA